MPQSIRVSRRMHSGCKSRDKMHPKSGHEDPERDLRYTSGVGGKPHTQAALPRERDLAPIVLEAGRTPGAVWTGAENLDPIGIRFTDRPTCSESLYRLRYPRQLRVTLGQVFLQVLSFPCQYRYTSAPCSLIYCRCRIIAAVDSVVDQRSCLNK